MNIEETMKRYGFELSASCAGKASYTKWIKHKGKRAYITVNDAGGDGFPTTLEEPVRVILHDLRSGEELEPSQDFASLNAYLATLSA
jgi:hypothetical protein